VRRIPLLAILVSALALAAPATAPAAPQLDVGMADQVVVGQDPERAAAAVEEWRALGVDIVRIHARWVAHIEPEHQDTLAPPPGHDGADPESPGYNWERLDRAIALIRGSGMRVMLTVTGSGPLWGTMDPRQGSPRYKPDPVKFGRYATAVARRYRSQVDDYIVWNEPNQPLWLQPQNTCNSAGRCRPYAPHLYRRLVRAAEPAIRAADPGARVMMGALAPRGADARKRNSPLRPLAFIRAMGCVDNRHRRVRTGDCRGFQPASAYGFAHHPHGLRNSPTTVSPHRDNAQMADIDRLVGTLDAVTRTNGLRSRHPSRRFPLYFTEYGYQTNPPDRTLGVTTAQQSTWLQQAAYMSWRHPRVRNLTQYAWHDEPLRPNDSGWQSGLRFADGRPKGALTTFRHPFWAERRGARTARLWGQVRPGGATTVTLERRSPSGRWARIVSVQTDRRGYFRRDVPMSRTTAFRFRYADGTSSTRTVRIR
jgi:hypothetical protein